MSRARRYLFGIGTGYLYQALTLSCGLWLTRFLLREVGQEEYGLWIIVLQVLMYLEMLDLGVVAVVPRQAAYVTGSSQGEEGRRRLALLLHHAQAVVRWQVAALAAVAALVWVVFTKADPRAPVAGPLAAVAASYLFFFYFRVYPALLRGLQDLGFLGVLTLAAWSVGVGVTVAGVLAGWGLWALVASWWANNTILTIGSYLRLRALHPELWGLPAGGGPAGERRALLEQGVWISVGKLAHVLGNGAEVFVFAALGGPAWVVVYSCTAKLVQIGANQIQTLVTGAEPAVSELKAGGSPERLTRALVALGQFVLWAAGLIATALLAANAAFVTAWVGAGQYGGDGLTGLLLVRMLLRVYLLTLFNILFCLGFERWLAWVTLADGAATVGLTALFVLWLGLPGYPLGSILIGCLFTLPLCLVFLSRRTAVSGLALVRSAGPWLAVQVLLGGTLFALGRLWRPHGLPEAVAAGTAAAALYLLAMAPVLVRSACWPHVRGPLLALRARLGRLLHLPAPGGETVP
jgi:O-antigen/teichoic acid export membrane protein